MPFPILPTRTSITYSVLNESVGDFNQAMTKVEFKKASGPLRDYATKARKGPLVIYKGGKPFAAVIPIHNADEETLALSTNRKFLKIIERSRARAKKEGTREKKKSRQTRHHDLDDLAGSWSKKEAAEFDKALADQRTIDRAALRSMPYGGSRFNSSKVQRKINQTGGDFHVESMECERSGGTSGTIGTDRSRGRSPV